MPDVHLDELDIRQLLADCRKQLDEARNWPEWRPYRREWVEAIESRERSLERKLAARTGKLSGVAV